MSRKFLTLVAALALALSACAQQGPEGPSRFIVEVDAPSTPKAKIQYSTYFPGLIKAASGDTIVFANRSTEAPHTVTFGVKADRSNQPALFDGPEENAVAFAPCRSTKAPTEDMVKCPQKRLGAYDGTGYWNSGLLAPRPAPKQAGPKQTAVRLADDIEPGDYTFVCVLHPFMNGNLEVVSDPDERESRADVRAEARERVQEVKADAEELEAPELERDDDAYVVTAGWGDRIASVNRFAPARVEVPVGATVKWKIGNPYEPHTVTFGKQFSPEDEALFQPDGIESGGDYDGSGVAHSGILGPEGGEFPASEYSLTFTEAGTYKYVCSLHPGQAGEVEVTDD